MPYENKTGLPSVTEIINIVSTAWIPSDFFTEEARERGSAVHAYCSNYALCRYCVPLPDKWSGYGESFARWADTYLIDVILTEKRLVAEDQFCGQPDLICSIKGQKGDGLVDIKTGAKFASHPIQIAAYRALAKLSGFDTQWGGTLRLKPDGTMPLFDSTPNDFILDFNIFQSMLNIFNFYK